VEEIQSERVGGLKHVSLQLSIGFEERERKKRGRSDGQIYRDSDMPRDRGRRGERFTDSASTSGSQVLHLLCISESQSNGVYS